MDIEELRGFLAVVETGSISTAAHALGIKQPALSKSIQRLEKQFGVALFERQPRGMTPTDYGRTLLDYGLAMDSNYRSAVRRIRALSDARSGELVLGAGGTWLEEQLPLAIAQLAKARPSARITVVTGSPELLLARLIDGEFDMLFAPLRAADSDRDDLITEALMVGNRVVVARRGHALTRHRDVALSRLAEESWALPGGVYVRESFDALFLQHGIEPPTPNVQVTDSRCLFEVVANTDLLTYVPEVRLVRRREHLATIPSSQATVLRETGLVWPRKRPLPPLAIELMSNLRTLLRHTADSTPERLVGQGLVEDNEFTQTDR